MAAVSQAAVVETARRSSSSSGRSPLSHGRGGAGNMGNITADHEAPNLTTPVLKSDVYTTGRGGSGNMAKNDPEHPEAARRAQDVEATPRRESVSSAHVGRGGAANVFHPSREDIEKANLENSKWENALSIDEEAKLVKNGSIEGKKDNYKGLADKGKEWLFGLGRKK